MNHSWFINRCWPAPINKVLSEISLGHFSFIISMGFVTTFACYKMMVYHLVKIIISINFGKLPCCQVRYPN